MPKLFWATVVNNDFEDHFFKESEEKRKKEKEHLYAKYGVVSRNNRLNFEQLA